MNNTNVYLPTFTSQLHIFTGAFPEYHFFTISTDVIFRDPGSLKIFIKFSIVNKGVISRYLPTNMLMEKENIRFFNFCLFTNN